MTTSAIRFLSGRRSWTGKRRCVAHGRKTTFIFSVSIELLQLLLRLGTFQLSDIFYNTVDGVLGGLMYCAVMKTRKRL
ncbi:MAG: VanZ family protein [Lachnospiraceae bacterium]